MTEVRIPFLPKFREPMLADIKTVTSRTKTYGRTGDTFPAFGATFEILDVLTVLLGEVAEEWYKEEGFKTPEEFIQCWWEIHPKKGYDPEQPVRLHIFKRNAKI
jgi:uncharacterized protein YqfB (UPF0267 family)